jgi:hypothetical protein
MTKKKDSFNFNRVKKFLIHIFNIDKKLFKKKRQPIAFTCMRLVSTDLFSNPFLEDLEGLGRFQYLS